MTNNIVQQRNWISRICLAAASAALAFMAGLALLIITAQPGQYNA